MWKINSDSYITVKELKDLFLCSDIWNEVLIVNSYGSNVTDHDNLVIESVELISPSNYSVMHDDYEEFIKRVRITVNVIY